MRSFILLSALGLLATGAGAAEPATNKPPSAPPPPSLALALAPSSAGGTNLVIDARDGAYFSDNEGIAIWRGAVQVLDPQMYLECELLRAFFETNSAARPTDESLTNVSRRITKIIADTNVLIMTKDFTVIGDHAVYSASNDVAEVTGTLVVAESERGYMYCTNCVVNRKTGEGFVLGENLWVGKNPPGGSNAPPASFGVPRGGRAAPGGTKPAAPNEKGATK